MQFKWHKTGLIELIFLLAALIWISFRYHETLNLLHPEWIILGSWPWVFMVSAS